GLQKAFLRYRDPDNWPMLREALMAMGRADLIGNGKQHLIPAFQPAGTGGARSAAKGPRAWTAKPGNPRATTGGKAGSRRLK
ncbi:MAG: DUF3362 domain-containing protein, partial [Gallionellaceae bacterium]|nr:DUF3362 domain-containing protein [Gallionellaceae bacterium]